LPYRSSGHDLVMEGPQTTTEGHARPDAREIAALLLLVGVLVAAIGAAVSAAGAPKIGVVDGWGRIDLFAARVAGWEYVLGIGVAELLVIRARGQRTRLVLYAVLAELSLVALIAGLGIAAVFQRRSDERPIGGSGTLRYYTSTEQIGEVIVFVGVLLAICGLAWLALHVARRRPVADSP
jgi:hypothetical protein